MNQGFDAQGWMPQFEEAEKLHAKTLQNLAPNFEGLKVKIFEAA
jgi:hypothetical protein